MIEGIWRSIALAFCLVGVSSLWAPSISQAKLFKSSYVSFELPDAWECEFKDTEWVCKSNKTAQASREAIIILTAKEVGPQDSFQEYENHLKSPRSLPSRTGVPQPSKIYRVVQRKIADQNWVDGLHLSSEVPNYYTRYLATIRDRIAILVTFSAHISVYSRYTEDFFKAIESLRVTLQRSSMGRGGDSSTGMLGASGGSGFSDELPLEADPANGSSGGGLTGASAFMGFGLLLAAVGVYLILKQKDAGKKSSSKAKRPPSSRK